MKLIITSCIIIIIIALAFATSIKESFTNTYDLPRTVWAYWDDPNPPKFIKTNLANWRSKMEPLWQIRVLNRNDIKRLLPSNVTKLSTQHQSDWLRLYLLKNYGGVWMDAGIIVNQPSELNALYQESILEQSQWTGFKYDDKFENWFIMAPKNSPIIIDWFNEYNKAISLGFERYRRRIEYQGIKTDDLFKHKDDVYLTQHACLRVVLSRYTDTTTPPIKIITRDATADMFRIHIECDWNKECIQKRIADPNSINIPFIKLRGADR